MILTAALLLIAPAVAVRPAPITTVPTPQWGLLRKIGRRADDLGGAASAKRLAGKADDVLRRLPGKPDSDWVLLGADPEGLRLYRRGGAPEGLLLDGGEGLGTRIRAAAGSPKVDVVLDVTADCVDIALELMDQGVDVSFLGADDEPLEVVTLELGVGEQPYVEVEPGVLTPLLDAENLIALLDDLGGKFRAADVALLAVFEKDAGRLRQDLGALEPRLRQVEVVSGEGATARVADLAPHPVLLFGSVDESRFTALSEIHGGPIMAVALTATAELPERKGSQLVLQIARGITEKKVGGFVEALVPETAPFVVQRLAGLEEAWIARPIGEGTPPVAVMAMGLESRGMKSQISVFLFAAIMAVVFALPAIPLGEFFAGLVGFHPTTWPRLKFATLGLGPFLPFAEQGIMAFIIALFVYWASWGTGWVLVRVLRRRPQTKEKQTTVLVGLCLVAPLFGVTIVLELLSGGA